MACKLPGTRAARCEILAAAGPCSSGAGFRPRPSPTVRSVVPRRGRSSSELPLRPAPTLSPACEPLDRGHAVMCAAALVIGGRHLAASSARESDGCLTRSDAISLRACSAGASTSSCPIAWSCWRAAWTVRLTFASSAFASRLASRPRGGDDGVLVEAQRRLARAGQREQVGDRLAALRVRDRVRAPLERRERDAFARGDLGEEPRAVEAVGAELEVRRPAGPRASRRRAARRAGRRRGSTSARRRASAGVRAARPRAESTPASRRTSRARGVDLDVQLVARRPVERSPAVGADLGMRRRARAAA